MAIQRISRNRYFTNLASLLISMRLPFVKFSETFEAISKWSQQAKEQGINFQHAEEIQEFFNDLFKQYGSMVR